MDGIQIPRDVAKAEGVPDDLDSSELAPYRFPNPLRRKAAARFYLGGAGIALIGIAAGLPRAMGAIVVLFIVIAWIHHRAAWDLTIEQEEALATAATRVSFAVGHASAAIAFVGHRSRPVWNVILYSAVEPPDQRALVRLDATTGMDVDEPYVEALAPIAEASQQ